jgi:glutaconate CoA-transferase subunit B
MLDYTPSEMMAVAAARLLRDGDVVFVGIGLPNLAINLAKRLHAPNMVMIYEAGVIGANPSRLPLSIGDPCLVTGSQSVCSMFDVFALYLQSGRVDVGFLGGAQIDRFGNINTTVIGDYERPKTWLPGSGGADDIATLARRIYIIAPHQLRRFPARVDFITSPGYVGGRRGRKERGIPGEGPQVVITDLGLLDFDEQGEMVLAAVHPGVAVEEVRRNTGWDLQVRPELATTPPPTAEELRIIREELDPTGIYLK